MNGVSSYRKQTVPQASGAITKSGFVSLMLVFTAFAGSIPNHAIADPIPAIQSVTATTQADLTPDITSKATDLEQERLRKAKALDLLFKALRESVNEREAQSIENKIWSLMTTGPTDEITRLLHKGMAQRREFDFSGAAETLTKVINLAPTYPEGYNQRAFAYFLQDQYEAALTDLNKTLELEPRHFGAMAGQFLIFLRTGRTILAQAVLREALKIHPYMKERTYLVTE